MSYRICKKCIMDTSDPEIAFDEKGVCCHCREYEKRAAEYRNGSLDDIIKKIKKAGKGNHYDCIVGVSGGTDSTYLIYVLKEKGLRPLAVHLDNGWDSELAVENIEKVLKKLNIDLYTHVLDWEEFRDLQVSFLKSSIANAEIPTDHAIVALLYKTAAKKEIKYIISGGNIATEAIMPESWMYDAKDWKIIRNIHKRFGKKELNNFIHLNLLESFYYPFIRGIKYIPVLNYVRYNKKEAIEVLEKKLGWERYGSKHYESIYTRFFQGYILPEKFGIDKRRAHLSTLINSGQISREQALEEIKENPYPSDKELEKDKNYVIKKLDITEREFNEVMNLPVKSYKDYPNNSLFFSNSSIFIKIARKIITK